MGAHVRRFGKCQVSGSDPLFVQGPAPNKPKMQPPARAARAPQADAATKKKMDEAAVMTHFWNNAQHIVPDAFSTYVPPMF